MPLIRRVFLLPLFFLLSAAPMFSQGSRDSVAIENEGLSGRISQLGAELQSIYHKKTDTEFLWQGDPEYWAGRAPVMFPVNVRFKEHRYTYKGKEYEMPFLGLAVGADFEVLPTGSIREAALQLKSNDETLRHYPFPFRFEVRYRLQANRLLNQFTVENTGDETLYFALGGHPGFNCPLEGGKERGDYQIVFEEELSVDRPEISGGLIQAKRIPYLDSEKRLVLDDSRIPNGGMFLMDAPSRRIGVGGKDEQAYVSVDLGDFPNVNMWTPPGMPFVCIEPMVAHHDVADSPMAIEEKSYLVALPAGESRFYQFSIIIP